MKFETTILYVDDEPLNLFLFRQVFENEYNVTTAESGFTGLKIIEKYPNIDVIISDMKIPGMNGLEFIKEAKELRSDIKYCILTCYDMIPEIENALRSGLIDKYFQKPFKLKEIEFAITERLSSLI